MPDVAAAPRVGDLGHLDALDEAALVTDLDGRVVFANDAARRLFVGVGGVASWEALRELVLPPAEREAFEQIVGQVLDGLLWAGHLEVRHVDGGARCADVSCARLTRQGQSVGLLCVVDDSVTERGQRREVRRLQERLARVARVSADLTTADDVDAVCDIVVHQAADAAGATVASMSLVRDESTLALVSVRGGLPGVSQRFATYALDDATPAGEVARTGQVLVLNGREAIRSRYPALGESVLGERSMVVLPLRGKRGTLGVITLSFPGRRDMERAEIEFLDILAHACAQALERIASQQEAARQAARAVFLSDATMELAKSLDYEQTLAQVARLTVPAFADWCAVDVVEDGRLHRLAVEHVDPEKVRLAVELKERYPDNRDEPGGAWEVIDKGRTSFVPEVTDEMLVAAARDEEHLVLARELQLKSVLMVPSWSAGRRRG